MIQMYFILTVIRCTMSSSKFNTVVALTVSRRNRHYCALLKISTSEHNVTLILIWGMRSWLSKLITNHHLAAKGGVEFRASPLACLIAFQTTTSGSADTQNGSLSSSSSPSASAGLRTMHSWLLEMGGLQLRGGSSASGPASVGKDLIVPRG